MNNKTVASEEVKRAYEAGYDNFAALHFTPDEPWQNYGVEVFFDPKFCEVLKKSYGWS